MLIIAMLKGVPARTTKVVTVGGILRREEMDIVLNPHDLKAIEAADYLKRAAGGKVIALSMGPDQKLIPVIKPLFNAEVHGIDEIVILSDRRMAGSDTWATSYTLSLGIKKIVYNHIEAIDSLINAIKTYGYSELVKNKASELYHKNMLPHKIYSELRTVTHSIIGEFVKGKISPSQAISYLEKEKEKVSKFIVVSGIKTTDGETGSVGPQVAEALSQELGYEVPHATYVEDLRLGDDEGKILIQRKLGNLLQIVEMELPSLVTVAENYKPRTVDTFMLKETRKNNYKGRLFEPIRWNGDDIKADPSKLGLAGSPTIVGPGIDIGKPPVQKILDKTYVFARRIEKIEYDGKTYGPFDTGDVADNLPDKLLQELISKKIISKFTIEMLIKEITI